MSESEKDSGAKAYVLTRGEMEALRNYWVMRSLDSARDGDRAAAEADFECANAWHERSKKP